MGEGGLRQHSLFPSLQLCSPLAELDWGASLQQRWCHRRYMRHLNRSDKEGRWTEPQALTQMLYQVQDTLQLPNAFFLLESSCCHHQSPALLCPDPYPGWRHTEQFLCPGSPELCRETPVTLAGMMLALVSFSRPEHTSLLPPSTSQVLPWAPASDMAPEERKRIVAQQSARRQDTGKESHKGRGGGPCFHLQRRAPALTAHSWSAGQPR